MLVKVSLLSVLLSDMKLKRSGTVIQTSETITPGRTDDSG